ncbi:MAG: cysteine hydrolase [Patescibacteria group bacterium]
MAEYSINPDQTLMLGVDWQLAFGGAIPVPGATRAFERFRSALNHWRPIGRVALTQHTYTNPTEVGRLADFIPPVYELLSEGSSDAQLYPGIYQDEDLLISKTRFNALIGTDLDKYLDEENIDTVVVGGLTTPICVQTTVDALMMSDRKVILLEDACASQALGELSPEEAHNSAIQRMGALFAEVISTAEFIDRIGRLK